MATYETTDLAAMRDAFPVMHTLQEGRPDLNYLLQCLCHLFLCTMSHQTHGYPLGKLNLAITAPLYALFTADRYPMR